MLIDVLQSYAAVQAHAGWLSKEDRFFDEATDQYRLYQKILCDSETGLWSQGRGWLDDPDSLSPGAWSRGHGWLMRGLVECLFHMPRGSEGYETMAAILREMAEALRPLRDEEGLWHAMLNLPHDKSPVETSGSALIIHAVACAIALGIFARDEWLKDVRLTTQALQKRISPNGRVLDACKGPGPLNDTHLPDYCHNKPFPPGESHGPGCFLYAFGGLYLLEHPEALSVLMAE